MSQHKLTTSFKRALTGIKITLISQRNFRIQLIAAVVILFIGWLIQLPAVKLVLLIIACLLVLMTEMLNTVVEYVIDLIKPRAHPLVELIKDISAGAVLLAAFGSILIALLVFLSHWGNVN